jgi:hypothetical protein
MQMQREVDEFSKFWWVGRKVKCLELRKELNFVTSGPLRRHIATLLLPKGITFSRLGMYSKRVLNTSHLDGTTVNISISCRLDGPLTSHTNRNVRFFLNSRHLHGESMES